MTERTYGEVSTAQELLDLLLELQDTFGTLDIPVSVYSEHSNERYEVSLVDVFTEGKADKLHSIDLNFKG